jgi:hypothetical protein
LFRYEKFLSADIFLLLLMYKNNEFSGSSDFYLTFCWLVDGRLNCDLNRNHWMQTIKEVEA